MRWRCGCVLRLAKYISYHLHPPHIGGRFTSLNMIPEQKRIAIAEACGWRGISEQFLVGYAPWRPEPYSDRVNACPIADLDCIPLDPLPDYFNDLNAVHELEKVLTDEQARLYAYVISDLANGYQFNGDPWIPCIFESSMDSVANMVRATASQRAEAFGLTLSLW